jgi:hypothetical protein
MAHISGERQAVLTATFAMYGQLARFPVNVLQCHMHDFAGPQAEPRQKEQNRLVALPGRALLMAGSQHKLNLLSR